MFTVLLKNGKAFSYILLLMTMMTFLSHGTQDLYPDFLKTIPKVFSGTIFGMKAPYGIPVLYNVGAIIGAIFFGSLSEKSDEGIRFWRLSCSLSCLSRHGLSGRPSSSFSSALTSCRRGYKERLELFPHT
jgi:hypothetical protein